MEMPWDGPNDGCQPRTHMEMPWDGPNDGCQPRTHMECPGTDPTTVASREGGGSTRRGAAPLRALWGGYTAKSDPTFMARPMSPLILSLPDMNAIWPDSFLASTMSSQSCEDMVSVRFGFVP